MRLDGSLPEESRTSEVVTVDGSLPEESRLAEVDTVDGILPKEYRLAKLRLWTAAHLRRVDW